MKFATLVLIGAVAAIQLKKRTDHLGGTRNLNGDYDYKYDYDWSDGDHDHGTQSCDDEPIPTGEGLINYCDQDGDLSLSLTEAKWCFREMVHH